MNYRHAYHAGNFADVFKHALLVRILLYLQRKETPFRYIETHAGPGLTDLRSEAASRTGEWRDGIGRLAEAELPAAAEALLEPYRAAAGLARGAGLPHVYPGSPRLAQKLLRRQDRATLCELHPEDVRALERNMGADSRVTILNRDGYRALKGLTPPPERRGLVLIDPPFEARDEFATMADHLSLARRRWETGIFALWYPVKDMRAVSGFVRTLKEREIPRILRLEFTVEAIRTEGPLASTGLIVVNPPYVLEAEARTLLDGLLPVLRRGPGAEVYVEQVSGE